MDLKGLILAVLLIVAGVNYIFQYNSWPESESITIDRTVADEIAARNLTMAILDTDLDLLSYEEVRKYTDEKKFIQNLDDGTVMRYMDPEGNAWYYDITTKYYQMQSDKIIVLEQVQRHYLPNYAYAYDSLRSANFDLVFGKSPIFGFIKGLYELAIIGIAAGILLLLLEFLYKEIKPLIRKGQ